MLPLCRCYAGAEFKGVLSGWPFKYVRMIFRLATGCRVDWCFWPFIFEPDRTSRNFEPGNPWFEALEIHEIRQ